MEVTFDLSNFVRQANAGLQAQAMAQMMANPVEWCSHPAYKLNPATHKYMHWTFRCKCTNPEDCESCARQYAMDNLDIVIATMNKFEKVYIIERYGTEYDCRKLRNKFGKDAIIRVPVDNNHVVMLCAIDREYEKDGDFILDKDSLTGDYIQALFADKPFGRRVTGGYRPVEEEKERNEEFVIITQRIFIINAKPAQIGHAHNIAVKATAHLNPDADTLQSAIDEHEDAFVKAINDLGLEIVRLAEAQPQKVYINDINWHLKLE